jgi:hypothetical protein
LWLAPNIYLVKSQVSDNFLAHVLTRHNTNIYMFSIIALLVFNKPRLFHLVFIFHIFSLLHCVPRDFPPWPSHGPNHEYSNLFSPSIDFHCCIVCPGIASPRPNHGPGTVTWLRGWQGWGNVGHHTSPQPSHGLRT